MGGVRRSKRTNKKNTKQTKMQRYEVTLIGASPLLMHADNLSWSEALKKWGADPANKASSVAGDDRTPAFRWIGSLYTDCGWVGIPSDNLMTMMREGGKKCPTGKGKQTFKSQTQSGIIVDQSSWKLTGSKGGIQTITIEPLKTETDFEKHESAVKDLGFELFVKRARVNGSKHVRVRPRFDSWSCTGSLTVLDEQITGDVLANILTFAGRYSGIGDWRPSSPIAPGRFGTFTATVSPIN